MDSNPLTYDMGNSSQVEIVEILSGTPPPSVAADGIVQDDQTHYWAHNEMTAPPTASATDADDVGDVGAHESNEADAKVETEEELEDEV